MLLRSASSFIDVLTKRLTTPSASALPSWFVSIQINACGRFQTTAEAVGASKRHGFAIFLASSLAL